MPLSSVLNVKDYLGGFFDGEGSAFISSRKRNGIKIYTLCVSLSNCVKHPLELLQSLYGGSITESKKFVNHKVFTWSLSNKLAYEFIKDFKPYCLLKRTQLEILQDWYEMTNNLTKGFARYRNTEYYKRLNLKEELTQAAIKTLEAERYKEVS